MYNECADWKQALLRHLEGNRDYMEQRIAAMPGVTACFAPSTKIRRNIVATLQNAISPEGKVVALFRLKETEKNAILLVLKARALGEHSPSALFCTLRGKAAPGAGCKRKRGMRSDQAGTR